MDRIHGLLEGYWYDDVDPGTECWLSAVRDHPVPFHRTVNRCSAIMELQTLANLAEIFGAIVVVGGLAFAVIQLAHLQRQRQEAAALEVARSFQNPEFARALQKVLALPPGLDADSLREASPDHEAAAVLVSLTLESVGIMVHRRIVSIRMVWDLMGLVVLTTWDRLEGWSRGMREQEGRDKFNEWIEWLVDRLREHETTGGKEPAYRRYRHWKPRGR